jgi:hypothetical protein
MISGSRASKRRNNSARRVLPIRTQTMEREPRSSWCTAKFLRHGYYARFRSPRTNPRIPGPLQTEVSDVFTLVASRFQLARERRRELGVTRKRNQAVHRTGWSFCLAANSSTAVMSSGSRYG